MRSTASPRPKTRSDTYHVPEKRPFLFVTPAKTTRFGVSVDLPPPATYGVISGPPYVDHSQYQVLKKCLFQCVTSARGADFGAVSRVRHTYHVPLQVYLAHAKMPPPLRPSQDPRHRPAVGSDLVSRSSHECEVGQVPAPKHAQIPITSPEKARFGMSRPRKIIGSVYHVLKKRSFSVCHVRERR